MSKYSWPLPGEGITAEELVMAEIRAGLPGVSAYSGQARRDAMLAEIVASLYNGTALPAQNVASLFIGTDPGGTDLLRVGGSITFQKRLGTPAVLLSSTGGAAVNIDVSTGTYFSLSINSTGAYAINAPTNLYTSGTFQQPAIVEVHNNSGGAITTNWNAAWHLAGAWTDPGNGKSRFGVFLQLNTVFQEISRSVADT